MALARQVEIAVDVFEVETAAVLYCLVFVDLVSLDSP
jgi:hypothetical protein